MSSLTRSYEAHRLWNDQILQDVLDEMRQDVITAFLNCQAADEKRLMTIKLQSHAIEAFAGKLESMTADAIMDMQKKDQADRDARAA